MYQDLFYVIVTDTNLLRLCIVIFRTVDLWNQKKPKKTHQNPNKPTEWGKISDTVWWL